MTRDDLIALSDARLREARILLAAGEPNGAAYLAGLSVECMIKACIADRVRRHDFPDRRLAERAYSHDPERLIDAAGLKDRLASKRAEDPSFDDRWRVVLTWSVEHRYRLIDTRTAAVEAQSLIAALEDPDHGVLSWLKSCCSKTASRPARR